MELHKLYVRKIAVPEEEAKPSEPGIPSDERGGRGSDRIQETKEPEHGGDGGQGAPDGRQESQPGTPTRPSSANRREGGQTGGNDSAPETGKESGSGGDVEDQIVADQGRGSAQEAPSDRPGDAEDEATGIRADYGSGVGSARQPAGGATEAEERTSGETGAEMTEVATGEAGEAGEAMGDEPGGGRQDPVEQSLVRPADAESEEGDEEGNEEPGEDEVERDEQGENGPASHGTWNTDQVVDLTSPRRLTRGQKASFFYYFLETISEVKTKTFDPRGSDEFNIRELMLRRYKGKPPSKCKMSRVRESVILVLDNSGSMEWWSEELVWMARLALARRDVEIYIAPNGHVEERVLGEEKRVEVDHDEFMKRTQGRTVVYVGDFDGADTPIELSRKNRVFWVCPEDRYRRFRSHNWVSYDEPEFRGVFIRAWDIDEMLEGMRRVLGGARWVDFHEDHTYRDDEEEEDEENLESA